MDAAAARAGRAGRLQIGQDLLGAGHDGPRQASQPGHCAMVAYRYDPKSDTYACKGGQYATGGDDTLVGRIREDPSLESGLDLWIVADNVRKELVPRALGL